MYKKSKILINQIKINLMLTQIKEWKISETFALITSKAIKNNQFLIFILLSETLWFETEIFFSNFLKINSMSKKESPKLLKKSTKPTNKIKSNLTLQTLFSTIINLLLLELSFLFS